MKKLTLLCLIAFVLGACDDGRKSSSSSSGSDEDKEAATEAPAEPSAADAAVAPAPEPAPKEPDESEELAWEDARRVAETAMAYLTIAESLGPDHATAIKYRNLIGEALSIEADEAEAFVPAMLEGVANELKPFAESHPALLLQMKSLGTGLAGETSVTEFVKAVNGLSSIEAAGQIGRLTRIAHGLRALRAGHGSAGSGAFGATNAFVCPDAQWSAGAVMGPHAAIEVPDDESVVKTLAVCLEPRCAGVSGKTDAGALLDALAECSESGIPSALASRAEVRSARGALALLAAGHVGSDREALGASEWLAGEQLREATLAAIDSRLGELALELGATPSVSAVPEYPHFTGDAAIPYLLTLGDAPSFGAIARLVWKDGAITISGTTVAFDNQKPETLAAHLKDDLPKNVGIIAPPSTSLATLRGALRALRGAELNGHLAVAGANGVAWLPLDSNPGAITDTLIQQTGPLVSVWHDPGKVSEAAVESLAPPTEEAPLPGASHRVQADNGVVDALVGVHAALSDAAIARVLLDLDDTSLVGDLLVLVNVIDFPRAGLPTERESLLLADPKAAERRLEAIVITEERATTLPGTPAPPRQGVTLPRAGDVAVLTGELDRAAVALALSTLAEPLRICFERELEGEPTLKGMIELQVVLGDDGKPTAKVLSNTTGNDMLQACVEDGLDVVSLPTAKGEIRLPFLFDPPQPEVQ